MEGFFNIRKKRKKSQLFIAKNEFRVILESLFFYSIFLKSAQAILPPALKSNFARLQGVPEFIGHLRRSIDAAE